MMKAAVVHGLGQDPVYGDFEAAIPHRDECRITVTAAAISHLVRSRASGSHYSASGRFPFVIGVDGVGRRDDGSRVFFALPRAPFGSMAEETVVPEAQCIALPDALDDVTAAAIAIPGMSSWAAYAERAKLRAGETVLVNGATGASGRLAVQIAKHLGASKIIATGRNPDALHDVAELGADVTIALDGDGKALEHALTEQFSIGVDVVIDYLWGPSARSLLLAGAKAGPAGVPIRFVQVGSIGGSEISLPGAALRSSGIVLMGSGLNSVPGDRLFAAMSEVLRAAIPSGFKIATTTLPLSEVGRAWKSDDTGRRMVLIASGAT